MPRQGRGAGGARAGKAEIRPQAGVSVREKPEKVSVAVWRFSTPYPPSSNNLYMTVRNRRVKTQVARDFADIIGDMASILRARNGTPTPPYRLLIDLWAPDLRRRDADNGVKCLQDALIKATGFDDAEVLELRVLKRGVDRTHPRADVTLETIATASGEGA